MRIGRWSIQGTFPSYQCLSQLFNIDHGSSNLLPCIGSLGSDLLIWSVLALAWIWGQSPSCHRHVMPLWPLQRCFAASFGLITVIWTSFITALGLLEASIGRSNAYNPASTNRWSRCISWSSRVFLGCERSQLHSLTPTKGLLIINWT